MKSSAFLILCIFSCAISASNTGSFEALLRLFQGFNPESLPLQNPFDLNVVKTPECRDDLEHWMLSLSTLMEAMLLNCSNNDVECQAIKSNLTQTNMFAIQQIDAFGRIPPNIMSLNTMWEGSWEECLAVRSPTRKSYRAQFCWQDIATPITLIAVNQSTFPPDLCESMQGLITMAHWSTCMPRSCTDQDLTAIFQSINSVMPDNTKNMLKFCNTGCRPYNPPKKNGGFWVIIAILSIAGFLMLVSTVIDYSTDCPEGTYKQLRSGTGMRCLLTFSMYTNGAEILASKPIPGQIASLHCIRVFSMTWVMLGHVLTQYMYGNNLKEVMESNDKFLHTAFSNAYFSVDSFLFLGGLLLTFLFIKEMDRTPSKLKSGSYWFLYYLHRILRLSPPYWLWLGFATVMFDFLTVGPRMQIPVLTTMDSCKHNWWRNILYINNLFDLENMCMGHTWYLALDMQIHIFAPLFLVPLALHLFGGIISGILLIALSTGLNYWAYYKWDLPATFTGFMAHAADLKLTDTAKFQQYIYFCSWVRYTPYIIGGWTGYYLYQMKKRNRKLRLHWIITLSLWICATAIGIGCVYGLYDYTKGGDISLFGRASYYNWSRIGWAIALSWIVIACEHNLAGLIKPFMEFPLWAPFSRLTYCAYLTHYFLIPIQFALGRGPLHYSSHTDVYINGALPLFVLSYFVSFIWSCAFEMPSMKLEKMWTAAVFGGVVRRPDVRAAALPEKQLDTKQKLPDDAWATSDTSGGKQNGNVVSISNGSIANGKLENGDARWRPATATRDPNSPAFYVENANEVPERL